MTSCVLSSDKDLPGLCAKITEKAKSFSEDVKTRAGMFVIFVSHQWLGATHPDPRGEQLAVLRQSLTGIIEGSLHVEGDMISLIKGRPTFQLPDAIRKEIQHGFLFLDWFAIPQITARHEGVNEDVTRSNAALAVQSIPAYVEASDVFVALVPELPHVTRGTRCNYPSWLSRGWCRAETILSPSVQQA